MSVAWVHNKLTISTPRFQGTMKKSDKKLIVVKKFIYALSAAEAIRVERKMKPDEVWIDDDWRKNQSQDKTGAIGFVVSEYED